MKIYLTGPLQNLGADGRSEMQQALYAIPGTYSKSSPLMFDELDRPEPEFKTHIQERINEMLNCDVVVTMDHIDLDEVCALEIKVARHAKMEVVPFWKFKASVNAGI
ncbi:MAG: hypothetical protein ACKVQV_15915 [Bacteroidia bacterium]